MRYINRHIDIEMGRTTHELENNDELRFSIFHKDDAGMQTLQPTQSKQKTETDS